MPWVRFTTDFDFKPKRAVTLAYRRGDECNVTTPCAAKAVAAGKAVRLRKVSKATKPVEYGDGSERRTD
ncbi:hypothetical protein [Mesorhizobium sp. CN2-181]|uniref:hypothetical protein n=1 Tax=Mesorhizobium yinganensis TaxID=3157707 RepID=UPI0032B7ABB7